MNAKFRWHYISVWSLIARAINVQIKVTDQTARTSTLIFLFNRSEIRYVVSMTWQYHINILSYRHNFGVVERGSSVESK